MGKSFGEHRGEVVVGENLIDCIRKQDPIYCCIQEKKKHPHHQKSLPQSEKLENVLQEMDLKAISYNYFNSSKI